jgi:DNA-binding NtrC family response regulator
MKNKVILIDDNAWEQIAGRLESMFSLNGLDLEIFQSVDSYYAAMPKRTGRCPADMFVVDVMMPPGVTYKGEDTHDGLITGLYFAKDIRSRYPLVPIILWSGTSLDTVRLLAVHMEKRLTKCIFIKKPFPAEKLIEVISGYFKYGRFTSSFTRRIWQGIVVSPSIGGLGIDVKKLLDSGG